MKLGRNFYNTMANKIDFSIQEKVELIINLYTGPNGYLVETIDEFPEGRKFLEAGFMYLDTENNIYYANEKGNDYLHIAIKTISESVVDLFKKNGWTLTQNDLLLWLSETLKLEDDFTIDRIYHYIFDNLPTYGYRTYFSRIRDKYVLEKI